MKKFGLLSLVFGLMFTFVGCGVNNNETSNVDLSETEVAETIDSLTGSDVVAQEVTDEEAVETVKVEVAELESNDTVDPSYSLRDVNNTEVKENNKVDAKVDTNTETNENNDTVASSDEISEVEVVEEDDTKILVVYYSRADENYSVGVVDKGNTKFLAEHIANYLGADSFEIKPVTPYPADYDETTEIAKKEQRENARPEYIGDVKNWNDYDIVFLGYPIWWGDLPMIAYSFIEKHDFTGKTVYLFNTHEGSGIAGTYSSLKNKLSSADVNTDGLPMKGSDARKDSAKGEVEKWLKGLGF